MWPVEGLDMRIQAVFFDLDDTLVHSHLDFKQMRADLAIPPKSDILAEVEAIKDPEHKKKSLDIIARHEFIGAEKSSIIPGAIELLDFLAANKIKSGILTRNSTYCAELMLKKHNINIGPIFTRDNCLAKPHPDGLLKLAAHHNLETKDCAYIGDGHFDMQAALKAGMKSWFFKTAKNSPPPFSVDFTLTDLKSVINMLL